MENIAKHIEQITLLLDGLDLSKKCKFSAWCCNSILEQSNMKEVLFKIYQNHMTYQMLQAIIQACWYNYELINFNPTLELIEDMQFNSEDYPDFFVELEGLNELLVAIECIVYGIKHNDNSYFANIAENAINWKDVQVEYPSSTNGAIELENYKNEYIIQIKFLEDLKTKDLSVLSLHDYRY